jgi:thiamine biosynthesis lipoprotein
MVDFLSTTFKAMGSTISIQAKMLDEKPFLEIKKLFAEYEQAASRFIKDNPLDKINKHLGEWVDVPSCLSEMIQSAYVSYRYTNGAFDPRILGNLIDAGYVETFENNKWSSMTTRTVSIVEQWSPEIRKESVKVGNMPIDLGGIGKSFTAKKAADILKEYSSDYFVNAGGDVVFAGLSPEGEKWRVSVENPYDMNKVAAVIEVTDTSVATSSISKRKWITSDERRMHHIINPKTGQPADGEIIAVTIIHPDAVWAEVWAKSLFFMSSKDLALNTSNLSIPALWFTEDGKMSYNMAMKPYVIWTV